MPAIIASARGRRALGVRSLAAFGLVSGSVQAYAAVFVPKEPLPHPLAVIISMALASVAWAVWRTWPKSVVAREFDNPEMTLTVKMGDLFAEPGQIVVGFSDTFDTDITDNEIVSSRSLQGQLLVRQFGGDVQKLDAALSAALKSTSHLETEKASDKKGKRRRYPIGTVAVFDDEHDHRIFAIAYSRIGNDLVAQSTIHDLWYSLGQLWDSVFQLGQHQPVSMPLIGTQLARIQCVDRESLLRMILLSFVARSREQKLCSDFTIVVHQDDWLKMDLLEVEAFLYTL